jgi:hypothetical protein
MSPLIEWRVNEDNREQTIVKTPSTSLRRWRLSLIALMIVLGASLGAIYSSVKEPAPRPSPTPTIAPSPTPIPTAEPPSVFETIDREAQALADGDFKTFLLLQDQSDPLWYQSQSRNFQAWGRPSGYQIPKAGVLPDGTAWAEVDQYRNGQYFRETRFYRNVNGEWLRTQPDPSFWSGQYQSTQTQHFEVIYPIEDRDLISTTIDRFESTYDQVCLDLRCPNSLTATLVKLFVQPTTNQLESTQPNQQAAIWLSSPRILGFYDIDVETARRLNDPVLHVATDNLIPTLIQLLAGGSERWPRNGPSSFYLQAVEAWELNRLSSKPDMMPLLPPAQLSNDIPLIKLESLWTMQSVPSNPEQVANSVIFFIEQKYGVDSVGNFLKAIDPADSWAQTIKISLGMDAIQFEQQWKAWLKEVYAQGS